MGRGVGVGVGVGWEVLITGSGMKIGKHLKSKTKIKFRCLINIVTNLKLKENRHDFSVEHSHQVNFVTVSRPVHYVVISAPQ